MLKACFHLMVLALIVVPPLSMLAAAGTLPGVLTTDRSRYSPGETVRFTLSLDRHPQNAEVRVLYLRLAEPVDSALVRTGESDTISWTWKPPAGDYQGYLVSAYAKCGTDSGEFVEGVDVSSNWAKYPRYGFLASFPEMTGPAIDSIVQVLNDFHINGVMFYDWQYKHHMPLKGTPADPAGHWPDIACRTTSRRTVEKYLDAVHAHGMMAMSYNLLYGAYADGAADGVDTLGWGLYRDANRTQRYMFDLPAGWASKLYFMDPENASWQKFLFRKESDAFKAFRFDGWHVDQVGDPGPLFDARGEMRTVSKGFLPFLAGARRALDIPLVMNAVNQYGQREIAASPVEFLYTEVWECARTYGDLQRVIEENRSLSGGRMNSVLAAYMDYDLHERAGRFNTSGVLLTDAVIMSSGGAHIEIGEHMLCHEYFPNGNLTMGDDLRLRLRSYYDFSIAYERLLRGDGMHAPAGRGKICSGSAQLSDTARQGAIWYFARDDDNHRVVHLVNLEGTAHIEWRDRLGTQKEPAPREGLRLTVTADRHVGRVWCASPDQRGGMHVALSFVTDGDGITLTVPRLNVWDMIVLEYEK